MFSNSTLKLSQSIDALRTSLIDNVMRNSEKIEQLEKQVSEMASRVSVLPQPWRPDWLRYSYPDLSMADKETVMVASVQLSPELTARISGKLALLPPPPERHIKHVTICMSGAEQFVTTYDTAEQRIPYLCGRFKDVGLKVLEAAGGLEWEEVFMTA